MEHHTPGSPVPQQPLTGHAAAPSPWPRIVLVLGLVVILTAAAVLAVTFWPRGSEPVSGPTTDASPVTVDTPGPGQELSAQELAQNFGSAVWRVQAEGCGYEGTGTAFAVGPRTMITNAHVIMNDDTPQAVSRDGETSVRATVVGADVDLDIAVLETEEDLPGPVLGWADTGDLAEGQGLVALGYPVPDHSFTVTPATVMSFQTDGAVRQALRLDGLVDKGNSGGPALTSSGQVAGVVTYLLAEGVQWIPVAHTYDYLADAIAAIERDEPGWAPDCSEQSAPSVPDDWNWEDELPWPPESGTGPDEYGDDPALDALYDACGDGDLASCDELYWQSPYDSEYESFAMSCGETSDEPMFGTCLWSATGEDMGDEPWAFGDDPYLDGLWTDCDRGDLVACDELYFMSPLGSDYEDFGASCGGGGDWEYGYCDGDQASLDADAYGDDPYLDQLWDECEDGDLYSCDLLYFSSGLDTEYEEFGGTCGRREGFQYGNCS